MHRVEVLTVFGPFRALLSEKGVRRLSFPSRAGRCMPWADGDAPLVRQLTEQLQAYFRGERTQFSVPLDLDQGDTFDRAVWNQLVTIPYGEVTTYGSVGHSLGLAPAAARDVGGAVGRNPVPVIVPCHRVIGSTGSLVGFGAGLVWKRRLLGIENPGRWPWQDALPGIG